MCILGIMVTTANLIVLIASKFTSGGNSPALIFIRSLCVADALSGTFGIVKTIQVVFEKDSMVNCFLGESLLFTSIIASSFTLIALSLDIHIKLTDPLKYRDNMDKKLVIFLMIFLWNSACIVGFMPLLGWNAEEYVCSFFRYYSSGYLIFYQCLFAGGMLSLLAIHMRLQRTILKVQRKQSYIEESSSEFKLSSRIVLTTRIDAIFMVLLYVPMFVYISLHCNTCIFFSGSSTEDIYLLFFILPVLVKSLLSPLIHGTRTAQIWQVLSDFCFVDILGKILRVNSRKMRVSHVTGNNKGNCSIESIDTENVESNISLSTMTTVEQLNLSLNASTSQNSLPGQSSHTAAAGKAPPLNNSRSSVPVRRAIHWHERHSLDCLMHEPHCAIHIYHKNCCKNLTPKEEFLSAKNLLRKMSASSPAVDAVPPSYTKRKHVVQMNQTVSHMDVSV